MRNKILIAFAAVALLAVGGGMWAYAAKGIAAIGGDNGRTTETVKAEAKGFVCCDVCPECCAECTEEQCSEECIRCCIALGCDCDCLPSQCATAVAAKKAANKPCCPDGCGK